VLLALPALGQIDAEGGPRSKPSTPPVKSPEKSAKPRLDNPKDVFGPASKTPAKAEGAESGWSIILVVFRGEDQADLAKLALAKVQGEGGLPEAVIEKRGAATAIAFGHFTSGDGPDAVAELRRVQEMTVSGQKPYRYALLAPPPNKADPGTIPQYNLSQARVLFGDAAMYTLQVCVYGREDLDHATEKELTEARRAAEQAALKLRQEGEMAFYYHGPRRSMVTVGVFDSTDFDAEAPTLKSARLKDAMRRHPNNLYNGAGISEKRKGEVKGRLQPSMLVAIPKG
jgi:hypothetical protein